MEKQPLKFTLEYSDLDEARKIATDLQGLNSSSVAVSNISARQVPGASAPQYLLEFLAQIPTDIGIGLLSSLIYDALKKGGETLRSKFTVKIGSMSIECETEEDLRKAIAAARHAQTAEQDHTGIVDEEKPGESTRS